ncbi:sulfotransferase 1A1-like isoform X6 [Watersipora subatra]|uniref:sulfotransferase 1A1-like isoform X6 n=1 Tax=Watersipora subatra TaxID=2589382 RepID=UPI00355B1128
MGQPHIHLVYYEDLIMNLVSKVQRLNEFMGTNRSSEQVQEIAEATSFSKMKQGSFTPGYDNKVLLEVFYTDEKTMEGTSALMFRKGTNVKWETTTMVFQGTSEYMESKCLCMMDLLPVSCEQTR